MNFVLFWFLVGCEAKPVPSAALGQTGLVRSVLSKNPGFIEWADAEAEVFVLRVFDRDTNQDGKVEGRVGEHGEPEGDKPRVLVVDRAGKTVLEPDELIATDSNARFFVYQQGTNLHLFDSRTAASTLLADADSSADLANPCMKPRQAAFDISGRWLGWMVYEDRFRIRDLKTGVEETLVAPGKLWRAEPTPFGWAAMKVVASAAAFPAEKTSCACAWCPRFARSIGRYGVEGESTAVLVRGDQRIPLDRPLLPLGADDLVDLRSRQLQKIDGKIATPNGCTVVGIAFGASSVVLSCSDKQSLYVPQNGTRLQLDEPILLNESPYDLADWSAGAKSFVSLRRAGQTHVAVLNWETGSVDVGPPIAKMGKPTGTWIAVEVGGAMTLYSSEGATLKVGARNPNEEVLMDVKNMRFANAPKAKRVAGPCALNDGVTEISSSITVHCVER